MNYLSKSSLCLLAVVTSLTATAQETLSDKLQYKVTGRMLMDGGVYLRNDNHFGNGMEFNDLRVGMKATYQRWDMKVEIGYVGSKVSIKDAKQWLQKLQIENARLSLSCENVATITGYSGFDPEVDINGIDLSRYPISRTFCVGLNFNF